MHEEVAQKPMVLAHAIPPPPSQPVHMTSGDIPYDQLTEEEKTQAWFTDGSMEHSGTTPKRTVAHYSLLVGYPLRIVEKTSPPSGQDFGQCPWLFCFGGEKDRHATTS